MADTVTDPKHPSKHSVVTAAVGKGKQSQRIDGKHHLFIVSSPPLSIYANIRSP